VRQGSIKKKKDPQTADPKEKPADKVKFANIDASAYAALCL
jgi:hypothetical protein